jgi:thioredoxin reductase
MIQPDVVIVGAGPAGLTAADILLAAGKRILLIDEQPQAGGQFLRPPPVARRDPNWLTDRTYRSARELLQKLESVAEIDWRLGSSVVAIFRQWESAQNTDPGFLLWLQTAAGLERVVTQRIIIATGCYERPLPFPGWTLPGVMGAGAIQTLLKSQDLIAGERIIFAGSHPLQLIAADQLVRAGGRVDAVFFSQRPIDILRVLRYFFDLLPHWRHVIEVWQALRRLRRAGVRIRFGQHIMRAEGSLRLERIVLAPRDRNGEPVESRAYSCVTDCVGICYGFTVASELASQAGAERTWSGDNGGWLVKHDHWYRTSVRGLVAAGEQTGQSGSEAAIRTGKIAAVGLLLDMGTISEFEARKMVAADRRQLCRYQRFAKALNRLSRPPSLRSGFAPAADTILCRCENVTVGEFEHILAQHPHIASADSAKLISRVGMGLCQGRICQVNAAMLMAAIRQASVEELGAFYVQPPIKPVSIAQLLAANP